MNFRNHTLLILLVILLAIGGAFGQSKLKRAKKYMRDLNYIDAIALYNQILEKNDVSEAKINLAEAYRKINDTENAEFWYGQVVRLPEAEPIHKLYYGQMLQRNGQCDLAKKWYDQFVEAVPDDQRGHYLAEACNYEEKLMEKNADIYQVEHCDFNSGLDDFSPSFYKGGIVFTSERDKGAAIAREHTWTGNPFLELFYVDAKKKGEGADLGYFYGRPEKFSSKINSKFHDASVSFTSDENEIFFTRNNLVKGKRGKSDDGITKLMIFSATNDGDGNWGDLEPLLFNSDEYSVAHPALSKDGNKLYFASDMPGGYGGMDLYVSERENGKFGNAINLGPTINTEGHEVFPYFDYSGKLYFASDGHIGLGGLDIYYSESSGNESWGEPVNVGSPINSIADDFGITINEEGSFGYFSSDRDGGAGRDDIYSFKKIAIPVEVYVFDEVTELPIEGATIINEETGQSWTTNADGKVFVDMKLDKCSTYTANIIDYRENSKEGCTTGAELGDKIMVDIPLNREVKFEVEGIVFDQSSGMPLEGAKVFITNDCDDVVPEPFITDETGKFHFDLVEGCCYKVKGTMRDYLAGIVEDLCTRGLTQSEKLLANLYMQPTLYSGEVNQPNPVGVFLDDTGVYIDEETGLPADGVYPDGRKYEKGFLIEGYSSVPQDGTAFEPIPFLLHIYYDFDKAYIRDEAVPELEKLYTTMVENPDIIVEIGSHTDSRGSNRYNKRLSQRRAESVVKWLLAKGISRDRLVPRGYGETKHVNDCGNFVRCPEEQHQMNRRTEFRVVGCTDCVEGESKAISSPNDATEVDPCTDCPF